MVRVLSALVLLPIVIGAVWFLPPIGTLALALIAATLAFVEYAAIAAALGARVPRAISGVAVVGSCAALGKRPLAPSISPKKTREGAIGGVVFGTLAFAIGARYVFPTAPFLLVALAGASIATLGIVGDLFESLLKRSAGVKDSGTLIPG